jgi:predicted chitinase
MIIQLSDEEVQRLKEALNYSTQSLKSFYGNNNLNIKINKMILKKLQK